MYFALRADYSALDKYSAPDKGSDRTKHILVCTMLVGKYIKGTKDMKVAPALPGNPQVCGQVYRMFFYVLAGFNCYNGLAYGSTCMLLKMVCVP